jgi:hypothetical protein
MCPGARESKRRISEPKKLEGDASASVAKGSIKGSSESWDEGKRNRFWVQAKDGISRMVKRGGCRRAYSNANTL